MSIPQPSNESDDAAANLEAATKEVQACRRLADQSQDGKISLADALTGRAEIHLQQGNPAYAKSDYEGAIEAITGCEGCLKQLGNLHFGLGAVCDELGDRESAATHWEKAIECFEKNDPPSLTTAATIANNLGHLKQQVGDFDASESAFLKALEIFHSECGPHDEQTAIVATSLGSLYQVAGYHKPARDMHALANEAFQVCHGKDSPETGTSHHHLAIAHASLGSMDDARRCFDAALAVFKKLGPEYATTVEEIRGHARELLPGGK